MIRILIVAMLLHIAYCPAANATSADNCRGFASFDLPGGLLKAHKQLDSGQAFDGSRIMGDFTTVINECRMAIAEDPSDPDIILQYSRALIANTDLRLAKATLQPLVDSKRPLALRLYGVLIFGNLGIGSDPEGAAKYFRTAAELNDAPAMLLYAQWLKDIGKPEYEYAPWYWRAANSGFAVAEFYVYSLSNPKNPVIHGISERSRYELLERSAEKGFPWAISSLLNAMRDGKVTPDRSRMLALENALATWPKNQIPYYWEFS